MFVVPVTGLLQAAFVAVLLLGWARYIDRRPLGNYGLAASPAWVLNLAAAFGAVLVGHAVWYAAGVALGWTDVTLALAAGDLPLTVGLVALFVAYLLLLAWLRWHRGSVTIRADVAEWTPADGMGRTMRTVPRLAETSRPSTARF